MLSQKFICAGKQYNTYEKHIPSPYFKRVFSVDCPRQCRVNICGLGFYDLYINGEKITKGILAPYISNPDHICYYDSYDIMPYLKRGENVLVAQLGNGMQNAEGGIIWDFDIASFRDTVKLAFSIEIEEKSGEKYIIEADDKVLCKPSPIFFDDLRSGCFYDANKETENLHTPSTDGWKPSIPAKIPKGEPMLCAADPITLQRGIKPISIKKAALSDKYATAYYKGSLEYERLKAVKPQFEFSDKKGFLYDFGENTAGTVRLKIRGKKSQKISLQFCEYINEDGNPSYDNIYFFPDGYAQRDIYICKGEGEESFEPSFTYHGFRYCLVSGITEEQADENLLTALVYSSAFERRSHFECSDETLNTLYEMMLRSDLANFYYFPTDCPHREKNGWTGDANVSAEHLLMNFCCEQNFSVWLDNIIKAQDEKGEIPGIVPTGSWGYGRLNGPAWDRIIAELPFRIYQFTGKSADMKKMLPVILRYIEFVKTRRDENGLIGYGLGDWMQPEHQCDKPDAPVILTDSILCMDLARKALLFLDILGTYEQKANLEQFYGEMRNAVRTHLLDSDSCAFKNDCQTAQAMGIYYGIFDESEMPKAKAHLLELIEKSQKHFDCGMLGLRIIFHILADMGEADLAYEMITQPTFPSYRYFLTQGLTTYPEIIQRSYIEAPGSLNHHYFGDIGNWFIRCIAGIRIDENLSLHNTVKIQPAFIKALGFAKADYKTSNGEIKVNWERKGEKVMLYISIPDAIKAEVIPPKGYKIAEKSEQMLVFEAI